MCSKRKIPSLEAETLSASEECSLIFIRDLRHSDHAPARPHDLVDPGRVFGWTTRDVLAIFGPPDPAYSAELYTVDVHCRPATVQAGQRLSSDLMNIDGPLPSGHLELVLKPMHANSDFVPAAVPQVNDTESLSSASNESDTDSSYGLHEPTYDRGVSENSPCEHVDVSLADSYSQVGLVSQQPCTLPSKPPE